MDKRIRRNEICVIGLPRCDFAFSSTRSSFIAYGFRESTLEMTVLRNLLERRGILPEEAGGSLAPGQNAFCAKICSKIILSQFCIVLINNEEKDECEIPNANVNMEYGLMLGFNKYVIPFQRETQTLPFNVAGLDTIKYSDLDFERKATQAIDQAILATQQDTAAPIQPDQILENFLLAKNVLVTPIDELGERNIFRLGSPLGFNLLNDFSGLNYLYLGNFTALRPENILWRIKKLREIIKGRASSMNFRLEAEFASPKQVALYSKIMENMRIWILVSNEKDKHTLVETLSEEGTGSVQVFSLDDVNAELRRLSGSGE